MKTKRFHVGDKAIWTVYFPASSKIHLYPSSLHRDCEIVAVYNEHCLVRTDLTGVEQIVNKRNLEVSSHVSS